MIYLGDFAADTAQVNFSFNTRKSDGTPVALDGGVVAVYKDDATTALVLTGDCDLRAVATGQYNVTVYITQESSPFVAGSDYKVVLSAGTVDGTSVAGTVLAQFSIANRSEPAIPTQAAIADAVWDEALPGHLGADTTGTALDAAMAGADPATLAAIRAQTDLLGVGTVTVASPVTAAGEINITQGDSYEAGDISWTDSNSLWPADLDTADAITWYCDTQYEACTYTPGTGLLALGALATTQTLDLPPGARTYWIEATWTAGSRVETIGRGTCNVEAKRP